MSDADTLGVIIMLLCLGGSMFFSGSETALTSLDPRLARRVVDEGGRAGKVMRVWVEHPVRVLSTILVGNNLMNTIMGSVATAMAIRHLSDTRYADYAVPVAVAITTVLLLLFGEIAPKALGRIYARKAALPLLRVLVWLERVLAPVTWLLTKITHLLISPALDDADVFRRVTADEIDYLVRMGKQEGSIPEDQAALLQGIFRFDDKVVRDIMIPRDHVTYVEADWPLERIVRVARDSGHSRLPVCSGGLDRVKGILHIKSLVGMPPDAPVDVLALSRRPLFVSESLFIGDLLRQFKERRMHLAIVVDDGGHTVGVVTLEDVLEQIVGQIFDESDRASGAILLPEAGVHYVSGQASLAKIEDMFDVEFDEYDGVDSVGDLLTQLAGQIPTPGSVIVAENLRFKVLASDDRHVIRVSVERIDTDDE
ncbi:MAG: HlyC/CorC family transporter [Deltaproteobacteria bacterium]|nr:MAG: HlyC/CorC family transporter [Deltaproteobacteria bacterium]